MSSADLEQMVAAPDLLPPCPVKVVEFEELAPIPPEPVDELAEDDLLAPRWWQYRVC